MCGRFTNTISIKKLAERFGFRLEDDSLAPRFNIAPGQQVPVVIRKEQNQLEMMQWGLIPFWAKEKKIGYKMINARSETLGEKPSFKGPLKRRRCLIPADGFYEWKSIPGQKKKLPMRIVLKDREPFAFAGLWDAWKDPAGEELHTFTIITTVANETLRTIHDRMPAILAPEEEAVWLDPKLTEVGPLTSLLRPYPNDKVEAYPVSERVNSPKNDTEECILEVQGDGQTKAN